MIASGMCPTHFEEIRSLTFGEFYEREQFCSWCARERSDLICRALVGEPVESEGETVRRVIVLRNRYNEIIEEFKFQFPSHFNNTRLLEAMRKD